MAKCKECRFHDSRMCTEMNIPQSPTSAACHRFSLYSMRNPNELKKCKDCRFYGGERCNVYNIPQSPNSAACSYGSICK